jgi:formate-nitrite transporter family protein
MIMMKFSGEDARVTDGGDAGATRNPPRLLTAERLTWRRNSAKTNAVQAKGPSPRASSRSRRQQLFTENTLTVVLPLLLRKDLTTLLRMLRLWAVVLTANLVGTFLFALAIGRSSVFDAHTYQCLAEIGTSRMGAGFGTVRMRAIFAGWLIALMVWLLPGAESARVSIIIILTYLVGISGFNHIIAGSTTMFFLVVTKSISLGTCITQLFFATCWAM